MSLTKVTFLASLFAGILCLVTGLFVTRVNWREDVQPFGRKNSPLDVAMNPAKYASANVLPLIRTLNAIGGVLLAVAVLALTWEALSNALGQSGTRGSAQRSAI